MGNNSGNAVKLRLANKQDALNIRSIAMHRDVAPTFFTDTIAREAFTKLRNIQDAMDSANFYLWDGGFYMCIPMGSWVEMHVAVLPGYRGAPAIEAGEMLAHSLFARTPCENIVGIISKKNKAALSFSRQFGFQEVCEFNGHIVGSLSFLRWVATREDPIGALRLCEEHGFSFKTKTARQILEWVELTKGVNHG